MPTTVADLLARNTPRWSRIADASLDRLCTCLRDDGPVVTWLHGPDGAGKSALLAAFAAHVRANDLGYIGIDCRTVEPTIGGLLEVLAPQLDARPESIGDVAAALAHTAPRTVLAFDNYEVFRLADTWLRQRFVPALPTSARVVFASAEAPSAGWRSAEEWRELFVEIALDAPGVPAGDELARQVLGQAGGDTDRAALEAAAVVRRVTRPMLAALCPGHDADAQFDRLAALPFVESRPDGLALHEAVRRAIAERLKCADIDRYRDLQRRAWRHLRPRLKDTARADLWRRTADVIHLIENPVVRDAFFPRESARYSVEPAQPEFEQDVLEIVRRHDSPEAVEALALWWQHLPSAFHLVRDTGGKVAGFYCMARPGETEQDWLQRDPVAAAWLADLKRLARAARPPSIFLRRWLAADAGESPSEPQAAAWMDIKRSYLELRPQLRRVYLAIRDLHPYRDVAARLGFVPRGELERELGGDAWQTAMLDFGPGSVDGWIGRLLSAELGVTDEQLLDPASHELIVGDERIHLTPLEFRLLTMLESRLGDAVSREELLAQVWGRGHDASSNVVDAAVLGLRRKCGRHADLVETVRGVGYRLHPPAGGGTR